MNEAISNVRSHSFSGRTLPGEFSQVVPGWSLYVVKVPVIPIPDLLRARLSLAFWQVAERLMAPAVDDLTAWLLGDTLFRDNQARHVSQNSTTWRPVSGLGRWPNEEAPRMTRGSDFLDIAWGETPRLPYQRILRLDAKGAVLKSAWQTMFGTGSTVLTIGPGGGSAMMEAVREILTRDITDDSFQDFSFYFPLLGIKTIAAATAEQLEGWMGTADTYIRESEEDTAVLILTRKPLFELCDSLKQVSFPVPIELTSTFVQSSREA